MKCEHEAVERRVVAVSQTIGRIHVLLLEYVELDECTHHEVNSDIILYIEIVWVRDVLVNVGREHWDP